MIDVKTETKPETSHGSGSPIVSPRHIVENVGFGRDPDDPQAPFRAADTTLCGEPWDRLNVKHNGAICQKCVDEQRRRASR